MIRVHGVGPVYWGIEYDSADRRFLTYSWLVQDIPPYRRSIWGFRMRVSPYRWLHAGLARSAEPPHRGLGFTPLDIGKWGKRDQETTEVGGPAGAVEVRQVDDGPAGDGPGDGSPDGGGVVPTGGAIGHGHGSDAVQAGDRTGHGPGDDAVPPSPG